METSIPFCISYNSTQSSKGPNLGPEPGRKFLFPEPNHHLHTKVEFANYITKQFLSEIYYSSKLDTRIASVMHMYNAPLDLPTHLLGQQKIFYFRQPNAFHKVLRLSRGN